MPASLPAAEARDRRGRSNRGLGATVAARAALKGLIFECEGARGAAALASGFLDRLQPQQSGAP
jgi:hypothetical protein